MMPEKLLEDARAIRKAFYKKGDVMPVMKEYSFTDVVPGRGRAAFNGGEYGFYTELKPTPVIGVFEVATATTCNFDSCGTGYEGLQYFTADDIKKMQKSSDDIEKAGSLY